MKQSVKTPAKPSGFSRKLRGACIFEAILVLSIAVTTLVVLLIVLEDHEEKFRQRLLSEQGPPATQSELIQSNSAASSPSEPQSVAATDGLALFDLQGAPTKNDEPRLVTLPF